MNVESSLQGSMYGGLNGISSRCEQAVLLSLCFM